MNNEFTSSAFRKPTPNDESALLRLNNDHAVELSELDSADLRTLIQAAWRVRVTDDATAMVIALNQDSPYDGENFSWFRHRYERFVYIDRVVVSPVARGRGLARMLYDDVITTARAQAHLVLCAEVNVDPPNPASDAFHASMGFADVGRAHVDSGNKQVRYVTRPLT